MFILINARGGHMKKYIVSVVSAVILVMGFAFSTAVVPAGLANNVAHAQSSSSSVSIANMAFSPASPTVAQGTTVTWTNNDSVAHTVTVDSGSGPNSGQLQPGQTYSFKFDQAGTFGYHCSIHPFMKATVVVTASAGQTPAPTTTPTPSTTQGTNQPSSGSTTPAPTAPTPSGVSGGAVATGPVAAGSGTTSNLQHLPEIILGGIAFVVAGILFVISGLLPSRK